MQIAAKKADMHASIWIVSETPQELGNFRRCSSMS
jgi:hypothetical protein